MKKISKLILSICLLCSVCLICVVSMPLLAQNNNETKMTLPEVSRAYNVPDEIQAKVNTFFAGVLNGDVEKAYKNFLENSPIKAKKEDMETLFNETKRINKYYGKLTGFEFVSSEIVSESYMRVRYLGLCENHPVRWVVTFYKSPKKGWLVTKILLDDMSEYYFSD